MAGRTPERPRPDTKVEPKPRGRPPERLLVTIQFKMAFGSTPVVEEVPWPKGWPLPSVGDQVMVGGVSGFVTHLSFDPVAGKLTINTR